MRRFTLLLLLTLLHTLAFSQIVKGRIIDMQNRESVPFAAVYFAGTFMGTTSDQDGNFQIDVTSFVSMPLTIGAIGYYSYTLRDFSIGGPAVILLTPKVYEIGEVEISGRKAFTSQEVFSSAKMILPTDGLQGTKENVPTWVPESTFSGRSGPMISIPQSLPYKILPKMSLVTRIS